MKWEVFLAKITQDMRVLFETALTEGVPCLLGTASADGWPEISPKGSLVVFDEETLAYWERSHRSAAKNLAFNPRVVVYYRNSGRAAELPRGAALRFYGEARIVSDGSVRERVMGMIVPRELEADPDRTGVAVLIKVDRIADLRGFSV
jgi:predicted pyridoxine 5'-phosphate oxidase superfamily flavin-nucleotide-binding protein